MIVQGPIAWLGVDTVDRRRVDVLKVYDYRLPLPIIWGCLQIGDLSIVEFRADSSVWAKGQIESVHGWDGRVPVGIDLEWMTAGFDPPVPDDPDELMRWWEQADAAVEVMEGALLGVTVGGSPAWPDAHLVAV